MFSSSFLHIFTVFYKKENNFLHFRQPVALLLAADLHTKACFEVLIAVTLRKARYQFKLKCCIAFTTS